MRNLFFQKIFWKNHFFSKKTYFFLKFMKYFGDFFRPNTITKSLIYTIKKSKNHKKIKKTLKIKNKITKNQIL